MPWAKVDDGWWCHPKVMGLSLPARGLWVSALSWSCAQRTDVVPHRFLGLLGGTVEDGLPLVEAGLWVPVDGGWRIAGWTDYFLPDDKRAHIPAELRRAVYARDGHQCLICGTPDDLTLDHFVPWSMGGRDTYENLRTLCRPCNSRRGAPPEGDR